MSVNLTISRAGCDTEFVFMCGQRAAEEWVGEMAQKHGFRILRGTYPAFMYEPGDLDQAIHEVSILRNELLQWVAENDPRDEADKSHTRGQWDKLLRRLQELKQEVGYHAYFG